MTTERHFPVYLVEVDDRPPTVGVSATCVVNALGASIVIWGAILRAFGIL